MSLAKLLFYLLSSFLFFFIGMVLAGISGVAKGQGLAGGAIILGYGVMSGAIALIASIILAIYLKPSTIYFLNKVLGGIAAIAMLFLVYRFYTN